jgi:hypothetical protein
MAGTLFSDSRWQTHLLPGKPRKKSLLSRVLSEKKFQGPKAQELSLPEICVRRVRKEAWV